MGPTTKILKVVLDTSTVVSALLFSKGKLTWIRNLWITGKIIPVITQRTAKELIRVLAYPRFKLSAEEIELYLSDYFPYCRSVEPRKPAKGMPQCRDQNDQMFLDLACQERVDFLVSSDNDLLSLAGQTPFAIVTPNQFKVEATRRVEE